GASLELLVPGSWPRYVQAAYPRSANPTRISRSLPAGVRRMCPPVQKSGRAPFGNPRREERAPRVRADRAGAAHGRHDRACGVGARLRGAVHIALKIIAAVFAREEQVAD